MESSGLRVPKAPLSDFVAFFWYRSGGVVSAWKKERLLPTGTVELVVILSNPHALPILCGPHTRPFFVDNPGQETLIAAHFRPGGAFPFFGLAPEGLRNEVVSLQDVWGARAADLRDRLLECADLESRLDVFTECLISASEQPLNRRPEVRYALRQFQIPGLKVSDVTSRIGYCGRRFTDLFREEVGLTPKSYAKVKRFQRAIAGIGTEGQVNLADMAIECGFFDQAHFANDFREFSGLTPTEYVALRTSHLNHVPVFD